MIKLIINPGSTSIKYSLFKNNTKLKEFDFNKSEDFLESFRNLIQILIKDNYINNIIDIKKYGIRIVHGGNYFKEATLINKNNIKILEKTSELAPLHNPLALEIIKEIWKQNKTAKIYGVFDTSFHQTIPEYASTYAIPRKLSEDYHIQKYGFHGIACQSILTKIKKEFKNLPNKIVICHLGGGSSITAIKNGESIDTSMGFTPLEGLIMTTRSGDLDNGVLMYLSETLKIPNDKLLTILNSDSGVYGVTGIKDMETITEKAQKGNKLCKLAIEMFVYRIIKYIFSYYGVLEGINTLVFSGGIGEHSSYIREKICKKLKTIDIKEFLILKANEDEEILRQILKT